MATPTFPFFTGTLTRPGELMAGLQGGLSPVAGTVVEFKAYLATDMTNLLLWRLPEGIWNRLSDDTIVADFRNGDAVRMFGDFDYSRPRDIPVGGTLERLQETDGNVVAYEVKNLSAPIMTVLESAGYNNELVHSLLFSGNDKFTGSSFNDVLISLGGADTIDGGGGNDSLAGGDGADAITAGDGDDAVLGEAGDDAIVGGSGNDALAGDSGADTIQGGDGDDLILGGAENDALYGDRGNDELRGGDGHDVLQGGDGNDVLMGNVFNDTLTGGAGGDTLYGGQGWDLLLGGDGDDWLYGDKGFDALYGGAGADTFYFAPNSLVDRIHDFNAAEGDRVRLQLGTIYTVEQFGSDVLIVSGLVDQVFLVGVQLSSLPTGWIIEG